jgi:hypothetical protein
MLTVRPPRPGRFKNDQLTFKLKLRPWPAVAFWHEGEWLMPPHWDDLPGEAIIAWRSSPDGREITGFTDS